MKKNKIKLASGKTSQKKNSKTWLVGGITAVILIVVVVLLYNQAKGVSFGKAVDQGVQGQLGEACIWEDGSASSFYIISKFKDVLGKTLSVPSGWEGLVGCCGSKSACIAPNDCVGAGTASANSSAYFCEGGANGDTTWLVCDANGKGKLSKDKNGVEGKYYCDGQKWVTLSQVDAGKIIVADKMYWDGEAWHKITQKGDSCNYIAASGLYKFEKDCYLSHDALGYSSTTTCDPPIWLLSESYITAGRIACCAEKNQCAKKDGSCVPKGTIVDTLVCDGGFTLFGITYSSWNSAKMEYKNIPSGIHGGGKYVSDGSKWVKCGKDGQTIKQGSISYLCMNGKWTSPEKCKSCKSGENCVFSDEYQKSYFGKPFTQLKLLKQAEDAGRIACGKSTQCITAAGGKVNYDALAGETSYVCGDSNRWLKCNSNTINVVSDGGNYICDGNKWKKIDNSKKGCSNCAGSEYCIASNLYKDTEKNDVTFAFDTNRVGCTSDVEGCADADGVGWAEDAVKSSKYLCEATNWAECNTNTLTQISWSGMQLCTGDGWSSCGVSAADKYKPGDTSIKSTEKEQGAFLCSNNGWKQCVAETQGVLEADPAWLCLEDSGAFPWQWVKCGINNAGYLVSGIYSCDGSKWKFNYFDPSNGAFGGVGGKILPLGGPVGVRSGSPPILGAGKR